MGLILVAVGMLPFISAALVIVSALVLPSVFNVIFDFFIPPEVDAPDNWAVAFTRMAWLFIATGSIGLLVSGLGLWITRHGVKKDGPSVHSEE